MGLKASLGRPSRLLPQGFRAGFWASLVLTLLLSLAFVWSLPGWRRANDFVFAIVLLAIVLLVPLLLLMETADWHTPEYVRVFLLYSLVASGVVLGVARVFEVPLRVLVAPISAVFDMMSLLVLLATLAAIRSEGETERTRRRWETEQARQHQTETSERSFRNLPVSVTRGGWATAADYEAEERREAERRAAVTEDSGSDDSGSDSGSGEAW